MRELKITLVAADTIHPPPEKPTPREYGGNHREHSRKRAVQACDSAEIHREYSRG